MKAVVLAAGAGRRLRNSHEESPKPLTPLRGKPLLLWVLHLLRGARIEETIVVTGYESVLIRKTLNREDLGSLSLRYVHNPEWRKSNGLSLLKARKILEREKEFLLLMGDHLLSPDILPLVISHPSRTNLLLVEPNLEKVPDLEEATKVWLHGGKPHAIGKHLAQYNAVDCGVFKLRPEIFEALEESIALGDDSLTGGIRRLIQKERLEVLPLPKTSSFIDVDTSEDLAHAEALIRSGKLSEP